MRRRGKVVGGAAARPCAESRGRVSSGVSAERKKDETDRKQTTQAPEGRDGRTARGTPPPHRDFKVYKERGVVR